MTSNTDDSDDDPNDDHPERCSEEPAVAEQADVADSEGAVDAAAETMPEDSDGDIGSTAGADDADTGAGPEAGTDPEATGGDDHGEKRSSNKASATGGGDPPPMEGDSAAGETAGEASEATTTEAAPSDGDPACEAGPETSGHEEAAAVADDGADGTAGRDPADLTPDEVEIDRPDEFDFQYFPKDLLPPALQYTPEFDPDWVYPSGAKDGGTQDDVPVQGLEIGVLATEETLEVVIEAVLEALELYHDATGEYPRHRIVNSAATFRDLTEGSVGLAVVFQPRPDEYDDLTDHMTALSAGDAEAVDGNYDHARRLVQYLVGSLTYHELAELPAIENAEVTAVTDWASVRRIGTTPIVERYAPLAAEEVYDPTAGEVDISGDGVASVTETEFSPRYLDIDHVDQLF